MNNPLISVIIPVYNVEKYMHQCIDSVINQTYKKLEIILIDDGSTDKSGQICEEYAKKDSRIVVVHKENGGLSDARNLGIDICSGEYLTFVDSDDWISHDMVYCLLNNIKATGADISIGQYKKVFDNNYKKSDKKNKFVKLNKKEGIYQFYVKRRFSCHACEKLYNKKLFENIRYPKGKLYEDEYTTYKLLWQSDNIVCTDKVCYYYYIRRDSISHAKFNERQLDKLDAYDRVLDYFEQKMPEIVKYIQFRWLDAYIVFCRDSARYGVVSEKLNDNFQKAIAYSKGYMMCKYVRILYKVSWFLIKNQPSLFKILVIFLKA